MAPASRLRGLGVLQVEPTDHCNLSCRMCAPHHEGWSSVHGVAKGFLDPALWERILDGLHRDGVELDHLIFQWLGDPSLHPDLPRLVVAAASKLRGRLDYLRIDTNGILLTPPRIDALLEALVEVEGPPLLVVFTLDAQSPEVYARVKGGDHLLRVRRNIRHLLRRRRALGGRCRVNLQLQFVVQEGNSHEAAAFLRYWADLLACQGDPCRWHDELLFKRLSVGGGSAGQGAADALYERTMAEHGIRSGPFPHPGGPLQVQVWERRPWQADDAHPGERGPCPGLWLTPVIRHDGMLLMCCADLQGELALGNLHEQGFLSLWEGERATRYRLEHLAGRFTGVCAGCGGINWYSLDPERIGQTRARAQALGIQPAIGG